jgi:hypothetical protein
MGAGLVILLRKDSPCTRAKADPDHAGSRPALPVHHRRPGADVSPAGRAQFQATSSLIGSQAL